MQSRKRRKRKREKKERSVRTVTIFYIEGVLYPWKLYTHRYELTLRKTLAFVKAKA
jgi:hypothetical protein